MNRRIKWTIIIVCLVIAAILAIYQLIYSNKPSTDVIPTPTAEATLPPLLPLLLEGYVYHVTEIKVNAENGVMTGYVLTQDQGTPGYTEYVLPVMTVVTDSTSNDCSLSVKDGQIRLSVPGDVESC